MICVELKRITPQRRQQLQAFLDRFHLKPEKLSLINQAFIHKSYDYEESVGKNNERLEFLGDALIGFSASYYLYKKFPEKPEGELSKIKSMIVSRTFLARKARELNIEDLILLSNGEENTGGRDRDSLIGSALEAFVGALFIEMGVEPARHFVKAHILNQIAYIAETEIWDQIRDYKSMLQEHVQKCYHISPSYQKTAESGPEHNKIFVYALYINGEKKSEGSGNRKKIAENMAAKQYLESIGLL